MDRFVVIAHGALGPLDEILLIAAVAIFVIMVIVPPLSAIFRRDPSAENKPESTANASPSVDHFRLD